jgi:hypothetical protein
MTRSKWTGLPSITLPLVGLVAAFQIESATVGEIINEEKIFPTVVNAEDGAKQLSR